MSRLGRNPFENKAVPRKARKASEILIEEIIQETVTVAEPQGLLEKIARFFWVDVPAESFIFSLKAVLLVKSAWD